MSFDQLGLRVELLKAIKNKGYEAPTAIQAQAIPVILAGRDILARAQTGTGKTDAFGLPIVQTLGLTRGNGHHPRALILTPTRELALQVGESIKAYARKVSLRCTVAFGGVRIEPQIARLERGIDILVATPGRLLDLASQEHLSLASIEFLVFDEADRMLDLGFSGEINAILDLLPTKRRTMLFSATYTPQIKALAAKMLDKPEYIEITPDTAAAEAVQQKVHHVNKDNKLTLLLHLIEKQKQDRILVFARTRTWANRLTDKLAAHGISVAALHGSKSQSLRKRTLEEFKDGKIHILVATDVAARGLDISNLPLVVNYDIPNSPEDYVHRIGRTGRAGVSGIAVSLVSPEERNLLLAIEDLLRHQIPVEAVKGFTEDSDVPDFVLYRPGNPKSERNAPRAIKELVAKKSPAKLTVQGRGKKPKDAGPESTARGKKNEKSDARAAEDKDTRPDSKPRGRSTEKPGARSGKDSGSESKGRGRRNERTDTRTGSEKNSGPESKGRGRRNERTEDSRAGADKRGGNTRGKAARPDSRPAQPARGRSRGRG
ncbi:DEAD/DEAH box helicase [Desulfomicrobium sp. ZS1]|uniref:DEAD/DEAH box helicase n=1 Tax=Desulfomicrobium sp. ZS1 TaxID=2952228 RepID=UPI0020B39227|nr:DEAD/DEAH box helicase [Desulfomicrobium sp. ZS1]UTF48926.1 DEAD/DEAH box helicase [Desulfomicrobium sp. ZS1]